MNILLPEVFKLLFTTIPIWVSPIFWLKTRENDVLFFKLSLLIILMEFNQSKFDLMSASNFPIHSQLNFDVNEYWKGRSKGDLYFTSVLKPNKSWSGWKLAQSQFNHHYLRCITLKIIDVLKLFFPRVTEHQILDQ